ncbi:MAG TPA: DUF2242 domain-containing protein [Paraburkholderia sp.]|nr:DUF2242 domain-containing protein [Paraburkholderia sp.]
MSLFKKLVPVLLVPLVAALGACSSAKPKFQDDQLFSSTASPFSRNFDFPATDACEAARRGLLSQGYLTTTVRSDSVDATKNFQPAPDSHIVVEVHVVCTAGDASNTSVIYVNAVQDGYALKKSDTSASVGLSIFGSLSVPIRTNSDAMVKTSSETIQSSAFYSKFFELVDRYLRTSARSEPVPHGSIEVTPLPPPVSAPAPVAVVTPLAPAVALASRSVAPVIGAAAAAAMSAKVAAPSAANDTHVAVPGAGGGNSPSPGAIETAASVQPAKSAAADEMAATLPGIGEPPLLVAPTGQQVANAAVQSAIAPAAVAAPVAVSGRVNNVSVVTAPAAGAAAAPVAQ